MSFTLISDNDHRTATLEPADRDMFRADALEMRMYYVPEGETILVTRGQDALILEGGSRRGRRNPALADAIAKELRGLRVRAIVASHPHRDHTNSHSDLVTNSRSGLSGAVKFAPGALYFDNGIAAAKANFKQIKKDHPGQPLPFKRVAVLPTQQDADNRIIPGFGGADAEIHLLRSKTNAKTHDGQVYWSVFVFLRIRKAWMLFTGDVTTKLYQTKMTPRLQALNPRTHFLQLSHHGNKTGTSQEFVSALRPAIAAASTDDDPGHELDQKVRDRLSKVKSLVRATFVPNGSGVKRDIIVRTDGFIWGDGVGDGVLFEVLEQQPALGLGG